MKELLLISFLSIFFHSPAVAAPPENNFEQLTTVCQALEEMIEIWLPLKEQETIFKIQTIDDNDTKEIIKTNTEKKIQELQKGLNYCNFDQFNFPSDGFLRKIYRDLSKQAYEMLPLLIKEGPDEFAMKDKAELITSAYYDFIKINYPIEDPFCYL